MTKLSSEHETLLVHILDILETATQASLELLSLCKTKRFPAAYNIISDIGDVVLSVQSQNTHFSEYLTHAYANEGAENILDTLSDIQKALSDDNIERALSKIEFQLYPFLCLLAESYYFWISIFPDNTKLEAYYQNEYASNYSNPYISETYTPPFQLSIVIPVYNHLDMTKRCVEQLKKVTDFAKLNAEVIFIDHGSSDGSLEYLENLGFGKVIHFKRNNRMYVFGLMAKICRSKYLAYVSNDVLVTKDWAEILIECLESDPTIIAAVPATPNTTNLQSLHLPAYEPEQFIEWANTQNCSNPSRWDDRSRLMPTLGCYRVDAINKIGFADPYFYTMEFWDDDFSLRARRYGYRQILCNDVACYHFGSVTGSESQKKENTLQNGRELFKYKNNVDPWGNGFCYDSPVIQLITQHITSKEDIHFLGIDCGFGDTPLQIRNELRHQHRNCQITNITHQKEYIPDLKPMSDVFLFDDNIIHALTNTTEYFDCAYISCNINEYSEYMPLLQHIYNRLNDNGILVFSCANPYNIVTLQALLSFSLAKATPRICLLDPLHLDEEMRKLFSSVQIIKVNMPDKNIEPFIRQHYGNISEISQISSRLLTDKYYFVCQK